MALKEYFWNGKTYQIADEDLMHYPGAVPVKGETPVKPEPQTKSKKAPANKSRQPKNK